MGLIPPWRVIGIEFTAFFLLPANPYPYYPRLALPALPAKVLIAYVFLWFYCIVLRSGVFCIPPPPHMTTPNPTYHSPHVFCVLFLGGG